MITPPYTAAPRGLVLAAAAALAAAACGTPGKTIDVGETQGGLGQYDTLVVGQVETGIGAGQDFSQKLRNTIRERVMLEVKSRSVFPNVLLAVGHDTAVVVESAREALIAGEGMRTKIRYGATVPVTERAAQLEMELQMFQAGNRLDRLIGWDDSAAGKVEMNCRVVDGKGRKLAAFLVEVETDIGWSPIVGIHAGGTAADMLTSLGERVAKQLRRLRRRL